MTILMLQDSVSGTSPSQSMKKPSMARAISLSFSSFFFSSPSHFWRYRRTYHRA